MQNTFSPRSTHHTRSDQTSVQNSVISHPSLNVYSHDGQTDSPVPPRECNSCGTSDVDMFTLHEHVQTVMGGVCPGVSGQDNDFIARGVRATDYQLLKVRSGTAMHCAWGAGRVSWAALAVQWGTADLF